MSWIQLEKKTRKEQLDPMTVLKQVAHTQNTLSQRQLLKGSFEVDKKEEVDYIRVRDEKGKYQKLTESYREGYDDRKSVK